MSICNALILRDCLALSGAVVANVIPVQKTSSSIGRLNQMFVKSVNILVWVFSTYSVIVFTKKVLVHLSNSANCVYILVFAL